MTEVTFSGRAHGTSSFRVSTRTPLSWRPYRERYERSRLPLNCLHTETGVSADPAFAQPPPALPSTFKRLVAKRCGNTFREVACVQEAKLSQPGPGEVLVRVTHAGINGGCETFRARGEFAFAGNQELQDFALGAEGAGVVVALGPGAAKGPAGGLSVGQLVAVNGAAAFAEYVTARSSLVVPVPKGVGGAEAAALVLSGVTACVALEATARVRPGEVVAVTAAAGGTGHLAVQLAAAAGATVVAVVGGSRKAVAVAALGAHHVIDYTTEDVVAAVRGLSPNGLDVVYEGVGGRLREQMLACLAPEGRLLQVGYISEYPHTQGYEPGEANGSHTSTRAAAPIARDGDMLRPSSPAPDSDSVVTRASATSTAGAQAKATSAITPEAPAAMWTAGTAAASSASLADEPSLPLRSGLPGEATEQEVGCQAAAATVPPSADLFWRGLDVQRGRQRLIGQIWPQDLKAIMKCRRRVFDLARRGQLRVITDQGHGCKGVEGVADAVDYMLRGGHIGKVVIEL